MPSPSLQGRWQLVRAEYGGEAAPELVVQRTMLELTGTRYAIEFDGRVTDAGVCEAVAEANGNTLVLRGESGANAGRTLRCIFQRVGDRLRICYGLDATLPNGFTTTAGDRRYLATYRLVARAPAP